MSDRLATLVDWGLVERTPYAGTRAEYLLTPRGLELWPILYQLMQWGERHFVDGDDVVRIFSHAQCGTELVRGGELRHVRDDPCAGRDRDAPGRRRSARCAGGRDQRRVAVAPPAPGAAAAIVSLIQSASTSASCRHSRAASRTSGSSSGEKPRLRSSVASRTRSAAT